MTLIELDNALYCLGYSFESLPDGKYFVHAGWDGFTNYGTRYGHADSTETAYALAMTLRERTS